MSGKPQGSSVATEDVAEGVMVITYGPSGAGKTTDCGYSFPNALYIAAPGALKSIENTCGYKPKSVVRTTIPEVTKLLPDLTGHFDTVVIDDFSFLAEQTFSELEKKHSGFKLWGALRDTALEFRDKARFAKINVVCNAWEQAPKTSMNGQKVRGGPMLSGRLPEQIPAMCDVVLRVAHEPTRKPWPWVYRCSSDPSYVMKDRLNVASLADPCPMNLGEILRAAGVKLARIDETDEAYGLLKLVGLGMEDLVEHIATKLTGIPTTDGPDANAFYKELLGKGLAVNVTRWIVRDALDRATIRLAQKTAAESFFAL